MMVLYVLFSVLSTFLLIFALNQLFIKTNYYQNTVRQLKKFTNGVPYQLEVINTGSSYGKYGFDYEGAEVKGFNFALQPQSLSYDFKILKQYNHHFKKNSKVLIIIPDLAFCFLDYVNEESNTKYYHFLDKIYINGYTKFKYFTRIKFPILSAKLKLWHLIKDQPIIDLYVCNESKSYEDIKVEAKERVKEWCNEFKLVDMKSSTSAIHLKDMFNKTTVLLSEMIEFCIEKNLKPIIVVPPVSGVLNQLISKEFMETVLYKNIRRANTRNIPVLDYLYDERFQDYKLYINSDFLNINGRKLFTKTVLQDLKLEK